MGDGEAPLGWSVVLRHACSRCHLRFCDLADRIPPPLDYTQLPCMTSSQPFCTNTARSQQHHSNISVSFPPGNLPSLSRCLSCASKTERSNTCEAEYCFPLVVPHTHTHTSANSILVQLSSAIHVWSAVMYASFWADTGIWQIVPWRC